MKNRIFSSLLILTLLAAASPAQKGGRGNVKPAAATPAAKPQTPYEIPFKVKTLANGMEVIVLADSSIPIVTIEFAVRTGSITEPPELNGLSHLYEHMFFKPNTAGLLFQCENAMRNGPLNAYGQQVCAAPLKLKSQIGDTSYLSEIDQVGIARNAETHEEVVNYYVTTTTPHLVTALKHLKDSIRYPRFDDEEFAAEKQVVIGELDRNMSQPGYFLEQALNEKLFYKYPTRKSPGGTRETVSAATTDQMRLIQSRYYVPNNSALIVTGDVNADIIFDLAERSFGDWPRAEDPFVKYPLVEHPPLTKSEGIIIDQPIESVIVQIGWQGPSIGKDNAATYAADVFSYILEQPDSRFQRKIKDSGLADFASVHYYTQKNVGPIRITLSTTAEKAKAAVKTLYAEIDQFASPTYFTDAELENAKTLLEAEDLYRREKLSEYTHTISFWWSTTGVDYYRGYHKNLRAVTRADINRYVTNYIQNKPHIGIAMLSSEAQAAAKLTTSDLTGGKQ